ncbi:hypothetical protein CPB83DRAFT_227686 [Crepidotus variabilis]|uniref:Uncharacterized protein n=1 Tax=Crepidotus variabilis TaxID=179855 RepID=A0A9P6ES33_9AGAR|nr:hypothetical protein CPB83DRAFT_227686 [Crepidotus variabilis]
MFGLDMRVLVVSANNSLLLLFLGLLGVALGVYRARTRLVAFLKLPKTASPQADEVKTTSANKDRAFGDWTPVDYQYPPIQSSEERLADIKPIPYRPFKWGPYHVTMGLKSMPLNEGIELDRDFDNYHRIKSHRMQLRGEKAVQVLSDSANPAVVKGGDFAGMFILSHVGCCLSVVIAFSASFFFHWPYRTLLRFFIFSQRIHFGSKIFLRVFIPLHHPFRVSCSHNMRNI